MTAVIAIAAGENWAIFAAGVFGGCLVTMYWLIFEIADGPSGRLVNGADAESNTASELRRLRRSGWRTVHNLHFESGDVDHVAIGPAGVLVIETKSSSADWDWLERQEIPKRWAQQATQGAFRVRHLIRQRAGEQVDTIPILAMWVSDQPEGARSVHGVTGVRGKDLAGVVRSLTGPALTPDQIERIHDALSVAGQQFDEYVGVEHSGPLRRLFE